MGEIADMMINGDMCESCGVWLDGDGDGYPRQCPSCEQDSRIADIDHGARALASTMKVKCPTCGKRVKHAGLADHNRMVHGVKP